MYSSDVFVIPENDDTVESEKWAQISTLKMFNKRVDEIVPGHVYHVPFQSKRTNFILKIQLCSLFPERKPRVFVQPNAVHSWIDATNGQVYNAPGLLNFTKHSDLGRVVQVIIREFMKAGLDPIPEPKPTATETVPITGGVNDDDADDRPFRHDHDLLVKPVGGFISPVIQNLMDLELERNCDKQAKSELYPELNKMSTLELQIFSQNGPEQLQKFLDDRNYSQMITNRTKELRKLVTGIASETLRKKSEYERLKEDVALQTDRMIKAIGYVTELQAGFEEMAAQYKPSSLCLMVENQSKLDDRLSERLVNKFLENRLGQSTEQFIHEYLILRKRHFINKIKAENFNANNRQ